MRAVNSPRSQQQQGGLGNRPSHGRFAVAAVGGHTHHSPLRRQASSYNDATNRQHNLTVEMHGTSPYNNSSTGDLPPEFGGSGQTGFTSPGTPRRYAAAGHTPTSASSPASMTQPQKTPRLVFSGSVPYTPLQSSTSVISAISPSSDVNGSHSTHRNSTMHSTSNSTNPTVPVPSPFSNLPGGTPSPLGPLALCLTHNAQATRNFRGVIGNAASRAQHCNRCVHNAVGADLHRQHNDERRRENARRSGGSVVSAETAAAGDVPVTILELLHRALGYMCSSQPLEELSQRLTVSSRRGGGGSVPNASSVFHHSDGSFRHLLDTRSMYEELLLQLMTELQQITRTELRIGRPHYAVNLKQVVDKASSHDRSVDVSLDFIFKHFVGSVPVRWSCPRCGREGAASQQFMTMSVSHRMLINALRAKDRMQREEAQQHGHLHHSSGGHHHNRHQSQQRYQFTPSPTLTLDDIVDAWLSASSADTPSHHGVGAIDDVAAGGCMPDGPTCCGNHTRYNLIRAMTAPRAGLVVSWPDILAVHLDRFNTSSENNNAPQVSPTVPVRYSTFLHVPEVQYSTSPSSSTAEDNTTVKKYSLFAAIHFKGSRGLGRYTSIVKGAHSQHNPSEENQYTYENGHHSSHDASLMGRSRNWDRWYAVGTSSGEVFGTGGCVKDISEHDIVGSVRESVLGEYVPSEAEVLYGPVEMLLYAAD